MAAISFANKKLRTGISYRLLEWKQLDINEKEMLSGLYDEAEVYGIFKPAFASLHLTEKVAYKEVALLYLHLEHNSYLPRYLSFTEVEKQDDTISQLVLDGILEIEYEGNFVWGTASVKAIFGETFSEGSKIPGRLSILSMKAIQFGLHIRNVDVRTLSHKLYSFHTVPWDEHRKSTFTLNHSVQEFLLSSADGDVKDLLNTTWRSGSSSGKKYWLSWWREKNDENGSFKPKSPTFKLYVSPRIDDFPEVFNQSVRLLSSSGAFSFKVGAHVDGLLRPDKMVAYFTGRNELMDVAEALKSKLSNYAAQGVPFTAQVDECGMLSWGVDPPESEILSAVEAGSWRLKVTDQIALAIIQAQTDGLDEEQSFHFIKAKLLADGIDTMNWTSVKYSKDL